MNEDIEKDLSDNFDEFLESANDELKKKRFNSAVTSYFKAIVILCDLKIYQEMRVLPKNHQERFLFLQTHFSHVHDIVSFLFKKYRDSYNLRMNAEDASELKANVEKIKNIFGINQDSK